MADSIAKSVETPVAKFACLLPFEWRENWNVEDNVLYCLGSIDS